MGEEVVRPGSGRRLVKMKKRASEMSARKRDAFLTHLATSCNVTGSAAKIGVAWSTVYRLRRRDPDFAAAWQDALEIGYDRLEMGLVQRAIALIEGRQEDASLPEDPPAVAPESTEEKSEDGDGGSGEAMASPTVAVRFLSMTVDQAITLLNRHRSSVRAGRAQTQRPGAGRMPTSEETDAAIIKRLKIMRRQRGLPERTD